MVALESSIASPHWGRVLDTSGCTRSLSTCQRHSMPYTDTEDKDGRKQACLA
jgi:hypothetical protein